MWRPFLIALALPLATAAEGASEVRRVELYCTDGEGRRIELGGVVCIQAGCEPPYLARCEMSLNNVMWRKLHDGCPAVSRPLEHRDPALQAGPVDAEIRAPEARPG